MKKPSLDVQITGDKGIVDTFSMYDLVLAYSEELGINPANITEVQHAFVDILGHVYAELGVTSVYHPTGDSIGVNVLVNDLFAGQVQVIHYHDRNPRKKHYYGQPHWNQEVRLVFPNGEDRLMRRENVRVVRHQIEDSPQIT